jgi:hypothetical protein
VLPLPAHAPHHAPNGAGRIERATVIARRAREEDLAVHAGARDQRIPMAAAGNADLDDAGAELGGFPAKGNFVLRSAHRLHLAARMVNRLVGLSTRALLISDLLLCRLSRWLALRWWYQIRSAPMFQTRHVLGSEISKGTVPGLACEPVPLFLAEHHRSMELLVLQRISLLDHNSPLLLLLIQPDQIHHLIYNYREE